MSSITGLPCEASAAPSGSPVTCPETAFASTTETSPPLNPSKIPPADLNTLNPSPNTSPKPTAPLQSLTRPFPRSEDSEQLFEDLVAHCQSDTTEERLAKVEAAAIAQVNWPASQHMHRRYLWMFRERQRLTALLTPPKPAAPLQRLTESSTSAEQLLFEDVVAHCQSGTLEERLAKLRAAPIAQVNWPASEHKNRRLRWMFREEQHLKKLLAKAKKVKEGRQFAFANEAVDVLDDLFPFNWLRSKRRAAVEELQSAWDQYRRWLGKKRAGPLLLSQVFWRAALPPARGSTPVDVWQNACAEHVGKVRNALIDVGESDHLVQAFELLSIWVHRNKHKSFIGCFLLQADDQTPDEVFDQAGVPTQARMEFAEVGVRREMSPYIKFVQHHPLVK